MVFIATSSLVRETKLFSIIIGILGMILATLFSNLIHIIIVLASLAFSVSPTIIASFLWKLHEKVVLVSIFLGLAVSILLFIFTGIDVVQAFLAVPIATVVLCIGHFFVKK